MATVLDALASYIENMLMEMTNEELHLMLGVLDEIRNLQINLGHLKKFLTDADRRNITDESVHSWVTMLRKAMYDATDILDLCQLKAMERGPCKDMGCFNALLFCMRNPLHAHDIGSRIKNLNKRLDDIEKRSKIFNFAILASYEDSRKEVHYVGRETTGEDELGVVGEKIMEDTRNLVELLTRKEKNLNENTKVMVFAIVGVGGIGKTTLAKRIFNNDIIRQEFEKIIWLSVNREFNDVDLLQRAITEAQGDHQAARNTKAALERTLKEALVGRKTLLVMDDVWNHEAWEKVLESPIINSVAQGSRVLITTRNDMVARGMRAMVPYYHVDRLEPEDAWSLLRNQVVGKGNSDDQKFDTLKDFRWTGMGIIAKCDGLPLAVKVMGGLLRQKRTRRSDWECVLNDLILSVSHVSEELNNAIYLSYQDLHPSLKSCFLHYALLPKSNVVFQEQIVVAMWISEGFVDGSSSDLEVLGEEYYHQLIARNLIEPHPHAPAQEFCNMHDVVRSFAHYVARDEALIAHKSEAIQTNKLDPQNVIRLSLETKKSKSNGLGWSSLQAYTSLRTLILVGQIKINQGDSFLTFPCLRILSIEGGSFDALSKSLVQLKHLRYLSIRSTDTSKLPEDIAKMKFLQHINLASCKHLEKLPGGIVKLQQLRFLGLHDTSIYNIPRDFNGLTNLRNLYGFPVHMVGNWCSLEELGPLNQLTHLDIFGLKNVPSPSFAMKAKLGEKVHLSYLSLQCPGGEGDDHQLVKEEGQQQMEKVFDELCPPSCIEDLRIKGYFSQRLPRWMTSAAIATLGSLRILIMEDLPYCMELPSDLCQLPSLEVLQIESALAINSVGPPELLQRSAMENFGPGLEIVLVTCPVLERISNLPNLQELRIFSCPKLKVLEGFPELQRLVLLDYNMGTLPEYLQDVNSRYLHLECDVSLLTSIAKGKYSPEWDKFSHIKQVKAYADDDDNYIKRKWYVKYTSDPFSFRTNISPSADASGKLTPLLLMRRTLTEYLSCSSKYLFT
ncbi:hypothetical protein U9M48_005030 [Paspalum notatum var. saurae]|uniref:Uncharacterized protein n=1 Tax=Paspalum notatum var. saurae TaxID=547442 RepID=A0AAQ3PLH4_PASNO